jgi:DNA polymerase I-like protein with 3'-5' exonuclease and polymerase domains
MDSLFLDWETHYSKEYSLRYMSPAEYILDDRFESLGCGFVLNHMPVWVDGPDLPEFLDGIDWDNTYAVAHNSLFDMCILKWRYNKTPKMYGDTIAMARNWVWHETGSAALASLAKHFGLSAKMTTLGRTLGLRYQDIVNNPPLHRELAAYGPDDAMKCKQIFTAMIDDGFPLAELNVIHRQVRMATHPKFVVDQNVLAEHLGNVLQAKSDLLAKLDMELDDRSALMSNDTLAMLLMSNGVIPVPMKISKTTGKEAYAFAKTDEEFTNLLEHENPTVQAIVAARLAVKTTLEETRTQRFITVGNLNWPEWEREQSLPIPLKYSGAHTKRFSGDWQMNLQNLGRDSAIRKALKAPKGMRVVSGDASQIEARLNAGFSRTIAEQTGNRFSTLIQQFAKREDVYATFASMVFNRHINKHEHPLERFVGKVGILSCGYGASAPTFQNMLRVQSGGKDPISSQWAEHTVNTYRLMYPEIVALWAHAEAMITVIANAEEDQWTAFGPLWIGRNVVVLPNGNRINYRDLRREEEPDGKGGTRKRWYYYFGNSKKMLYGAKLVENFIQALAFMLIMEADQRIAEQTQGLLDLAHQVHDELIYVVPKQHAQFVADLIVKEMSVKPKWMPWLPLAAEAGYGDSYGTVKKL